MVAHTGNLRTQGAEAGGLEFKVIILCYRAKLRQTLSGVFLFNIVWEAGSFPHWPVRRVCDLLHGWGRCCGTLL